MWLLANWRLVAGGIGIIALFSGLWYYGHVKYNSGYGSCKSEYEEKLIAANEQIKIRKKIIKHETQGLDRDGVVAELCRNGWVRDPENCPN